MSFPDNLDFENLSNSLFHEWNQFDNNAIQTDDTKATNAASHRSRIELETIFVRVGLNMTVASRLADEVYTKLGLSADQMISFSDFLSMIQCHSDSEQILCKTSAANKTATDEYTLSPSDHMIFDMHAPSGLLFHHFMDYRFLFTYNNFFFVF